MSESLPPRRRVDRIQQILIERNIKGKVIRARYVNLFLGPVKCIGCTGIIQPKESVWRIVVEKPTKFLEDDNVAKMKLRYLGMREYRLCLNCEPPPRVPLWMQKLQKQNQIPS